MVEDTREKRPAPPLVSALVAMTALQAVVAVGLFAPGLVAPVAGLDAERLALWSTVVFAVGTAAAWFGGALVRRHGPAATAIACATAVAVGAGILAVSTGAVALIVAAIAVGLAFGPETPASTALLGAITPPERRPFVLSIRQTGNQIGAATASLTLPAIAAASGAGAAFALVAAGAVLLALVSWALAPRWRRAVAVGAPLPPRAIVALLRGRPDLAALALAAIPWGALQMLLNGWTVLLAVGSWGLEPVAAGTVLATAQIGGLAGRLGWGAVAPAVGMRRLLVALGVTMGLLAGLLALAGGALPLPVLHVGAACLGATASGWNGLFVAEIARLAPEGRMAETTGAVVSVAYLGLLIGPPVVALVAAPFGLAWAFVVLGGAAVLAALGLARGRP